MKLSTTVSLIVFLTESKAETNIQACQYCKRADTNSGFLTSFTYCPDKEAEVCIKNFSEYI